MDLMTQAAIKADTVFPTLHPVSLSPPHPGSKVLGEMTSDEVMSFDRARIGGLAMQSVMSVTFPFLLHFIGMMIRKQQRKLSAIIFYFL